MKLITNPFLAGAYIRLSHEDEDKENISESIKNQKSLIFQYAKENNYKIEKVYIDDGYSGTNFDRPDFKKMLSDIESKNINMVITKLIGMLSRVKINKIIFASVDKSPHCIQLHYIQD